MHDAVKMHEATLKRFEKKLGPDHPEILGCRNNLANAYKEAGRIDDSIKMHQGTLKQFESTLGPDHPDTILSRNNLAEAYVEGKRRGSNQITRREPRTGGAKTWPG